MTGIKGVRGIVYKGFNVFFSGIKSGAAFTELYSPAPLSKVYPANTGFYKNRQSDNFFVRKNSEI